MLRPQENFKNLRKKNSKIVFHIVNPSLQPASMALIQNIKRKKIGGKITNKRMVWGGKIID